MQRLIKTYENILSHPRFQEDANPRKFIFMSVWTATQPILSQQSPHGHPPNTLCVTTTTWVSRLWPRDTYWSTSTSSAKVKCFAVYQKLENNRKQQLNTHITLRVFKSRWKKQNLPNYSKKQRQHFWVESCRFCVHLIVPVPCIHLQV